MIYRAINGLIRHAKEADLITNDDIFVVRNQLMDIRYDFFHYKSPIQPTIAKPC